MSFFTYRSLTPDKQRIRLINLLPYGDRPAGPDDTIACTVSHVSLNDAPTFTALSYSWGGLELTCRISLNGQPFGVTANLETALRHLQLSSDIRTLWIDALSIDQNDEIEKSEQVQQMGQIYSRANKVIAWLGPAEEDSDLAVDWIVRFGTRSYELGIGTTPELRLRHLLSVSEDKSLPNQNLQVFLEDLSEALFATGPAVSSGLCNALTKFFKRSYWNRIWVVQELVRAQSVSFMCGRAVIAENAMHYALRLLRNFRQYVTTSDASRQLRAPFVQTSITNLETQNPVNLLKCRRVAEPLPLIHLLRFHRRFHASDLRDKIFALLGLSSDAEKLGISANYRLDLRTVYTSVARKLLASGFAEVLSLCTMSTAGSHGLPSWVPDWSQVSSPMPLQQRGLDRSTQPHISCLQPVFSAGSTQREAYPDFSAEELQPPSMSIAAKMIGRILAVGAQWETGESNQWLEDLDRLSRLVYPSHEDSARRLEVLYRSSVADQEIRAGSFKPRLSEANLQRIRQCIMTMDERPLRIEALTEHGLGIYRQQMQDIASHRRPLMTSGKHLGIGASEAEVGDILYTLQGFNVPFVLRPQPRKGSFRLVGETYVHGIMDAGWDDQNGTVETVTLL